jgi:hypothetical protein
MKKKDFAQVYAIYSKVMAKVITDDIQLVLDVGIKYLHDDKIIFMSDILRQFQSF